MPLVPILFASTLHTLIFALASAPLAAASVNFYRRVSNDGTPRITVAIYQAAYPASYAQLTMAFEETQRLLSNAVPVGKWLKNWGTACAHGLTKRFCQLLSPTKRAAHAAVRIQAQQCAATSVATPPSAQQCASKRQCAAISVALLSPSTCGPFNASSQRRADGSRGSGHES